MLLILLLHFNPRAAGSDRFVYLVMSLVERASINIDAYYSQTIELSYKHGHYFINTNPGLSFLAAPSWYVVGRLLGLSPLRGIFDNERLHFFVAHFVSFATTTALFTTICSMLLARLVFTITSDHKRAILASLLYAFGTPVFFYSTRLQQNVVIASFTCALFTLTFHPEVLGKIFHRFRLIAIGFLSGLGLFVDLSMLPFLLILAVPLAMEMKSARNIILTIVASLPPVGALMLYQYTAFGNFFLPAQAYLVDLSTSVHSAGFLGLQEPDFSQFFGYLFSLKNGLFIYAPFTLWCLWWLLSCRKKGLAENILNFTSAERWTIMGTFFAYLLYAAAVPSSQYTGFGPRYLLPVIPLLCYVFASGVKERPGLLIRVLVGVSFVVNVAGAQRGIDTDNVLFVLGLFALSGPWLPILDWVRAELPQAFGFSPSMLSPLGLLVLLKASIAVLWLPSWTLERRLWAHPGNELGVDVPGCATRSDASHPLAEQPNR